MSREATWTICTLDVGTTAMKLEQWEPSESRGSRWVLRAAEGAVPSADSPTELETRTE